VRRLASHLLIPVVCTDGCQAGCGRLFPEGGHGAAHVRQRCGHATADRAAGDGAGASSALEGREGSTQELMTTVVFSSPRHQIQRLPGLPSSFLALQTVLGEDCTLQFEDVLNGSVGRVGPPERTKLTSRLPSFAAPASSCSGHPFASQTRSRRQWRPRRRFTMNLSSSSVCRYRRLQQGLQLKSEREREQRTARSQGSLPGSWEPGREPQRALRTLNLYG